jgi:enoyl-CoA hydratase
MQTLLVDQPADGVTRITLNRPDKLNALTYELVSELHVALRDVDADHSCRAVILTGAGRGFCAGLDLNGFGVVEGTEEHGRVHRGFAVQQLIADTMEHLRSIRQPVIAAVNGAAAGGGLALALASDIRICGESAKFGTAFIRLGLSGCDVGVSWLLPRLIGASRAFELMLTARVVDAAEADELGLVSRLVPDDALMDTALDIADQISANSPLGVWMTKEVMWSNLEIPAMSSGIDLENRTQIMASLTEDSAAAMREVLSRKRVQFHHR